MNELRRTAFLGAPKLLQRFRRRVPYYSALSQKSSGGQEKQQSYAGRYFQVWAEHPLPIGAGLVLISYLHWRRLRERSSAATFEENGEFFDVDALGGKEPMSSYRMAMYGALPLTFLSRLVGRVLNDWELPLFLRKHVIGLYVSVFRCNVDEAEVSNLEAYPTLGAFFRRRLKSDARPINQEAVLTSPCDGRVLVCGSVDEDGKLEQIKGVTYAAKEFLGAFTTSNPEQRLFQITIYLAPGDYHCFHSPVDWKSKVRRHFPGKLLSVRPSVVGRVPRLFSLNERVIYLGEWGSGWLFSFAAVGATNVGSVVVASDKELRTNQKSKNFHCHEVAHEVGHKKGDFFGEFNFGSTIVLVFEATSDFKFNVKNGQRIKVGQSLTDFTLASGTSG